MKPALVLFLFSILLWGCSDSSSSTGNAGASVLVPLAVGNQWVYKHEFFHEDGSIDTTSIHYPSKSGVYLDTLTIKSGRTIDSSYTYDYLSDMDLPQYFYSNRSDGYWVRIFAMGSGLKELRLYHYPILKLPDSSLVQKNEYEFYDSSHVYNSDSVGVWSICIDTLKLVTVKAGSFFCYDYQSEIISTSSNRMYDYWHTYYTPGFGRIMGEYYSQGKNGNWYISERETLMSISLR